MLGPTHDPATYGSIVGDGDALSDPWISPTRHFVMVTLAYPMLTVATPLTTLFLLYVLFDCLDREMCFKPHPATPVLANGTAAAASSAASPATASFGDEEIRLMCLISLLFVTLFVGTLLILKVKRDGTRGIPDPLEKPLLGHV